VYLMNQKPILMPRRHIIFSTDRLPKILLEAAAILIDMQQLNKETAGFIVPQVHLHVKKQMIDKKLDLWIANNIVEK
jgi:CMP-N-acetylneuraminic acid synthetase